MNRNQVLLGLGALMLAVAPAAHATLLAPPLVNMQPGDFFVDLGLVGNDGTDHSGSNPIGTLVASTGVEAMDALGQGGVAITGSFISEVYQEAGGTLDFYYQLSVAPGSTASLDDLSVTSFLVSSVGSPNGVNVGQTTSVALLGASGVPGECGDGADPNTHVATPACGTVSLTGPNTGTRAPALVSYNATGTVDFNFDGTPLGQCGASLCAQTSAVFVISTNDPLFELDTLSVDGSSGTSEGNPPLFAFQPLAAVPEPVSLVLLGTTLALAALFIRRRHVVKVSRAEIES